jgi:hypothetical protein
MRYAIAGCTKAAELSAEAPSCRPIAWIIAGAPGRLRKVRLGDVILLNDGWGRPTYIQKPGESNFSRTPQRWGPVGPLEPVSGEQQNPGISPK